MNEKTRERYELWKKQRFTDRELADEIEAIEGREEEINDRFYKDLEFGTGGLRGVLGVGSNRLNIYTIAKASRGYAKYLLQKRDAPSIAIGYDSRINSAVFAKKAAETMAAMGIKVYIWKELMPTPSLSFAVRELKCDGGIEITASHNPAKYNGYKVYGADGCQITVEAAKTIQELINGEDAFMDLSYSYERGIEENRIEIIKEEVFERYIEAVSRESLSPADFNKDVKIVYTPLYGAGLRSVTECLRRNGFTDLLLVEQQAKPDGNFPSCPYPNPEIREALELGLKTAEKEDAELLLATDPDCDRVGIAVRAKNEYVLLSGNEVGLLLFDYICKRRVELGRMPGKPICIKTIVTTDMAKSIAKDYGVEVLDVLTGFKFIGEQIAMLEEKGEEERYIFGFEESYGYLSGTYVRDKDAVNASLLIAEMFAYYKVKNRTLLEELDALYKKYGYCLNTLHSFAFEGEAGMYKMQAIMKNLRENPPIAVEESKTVRIYDYLESEEYDPGKNNVKRIDLPKSDVIKFVFDDGSTAVFRPSGTEPKLKVYLSISAKQREKAKEKESEIKKHIEKHIIFS